METVLQGWRLTIKIALLLTLVCAAIVWQGEGSVESIKAVLRFTARTSVILFSLAYAASSLAKLWKRPGTLWLRRNRRYIGVAFAASHLLHAMAIAAFARLDPVQFAAAVPTATLILGGLPYIVIAAMTITSFDGPTRAIGPKAWTALHGYGSLYLWAMFLLLFGARVPENGWYLLPMALLAAVMGLRLAARNARRRPQAKPA